MNYLKVSGSNNLYRDVRTNCIINKNKTEYQEYLFKKNAKNEENQKIQTIESDVASIKNDIDEIKNLLRYFLNESR